MKKRTGTVFKILILIFVLVLSFSASVFLGAQKPSWFIIRYFRLPRTILVLLAGALLAASGAIFQMFFRNPLAEPGLLGISSGATLGAVTAACLGGISFAGGFISVINLSAFAGAFVSGLLLAFISSSSKRVSSVILLLCGTALGTFYSAISSSIMLIHNKELYGIFSWLLGSFNGRGINELKFVLIPAVFAFVFIGLILNPLDVLNGGEESASSLGVNIKGLRLIVILAGSLAVSVAVCAGGTISFVGLVAPHIMRKLFSSKSKTLVWTSALGGGVLLLLSDTFARLVLKPGELPCGIVTSFIGVPFFIALVFQKKSRKNQTFVLPKKSQNEKESLKKNLSFGEKILVPQNLELQNFSYSYDRSENSVLSNISVSLKPGDFSCLCGPNGAGKSTLLRALSDSCKIVNQKEKAKRISIMFQNESPLWDYSVFDTVLSGRFCHTGKLGNYTKKDYEITWDVINEFGLESLAGKSVHQISGGEYQKVRLARSFAQGAVYLLLDEPLSSLDFIASENLMNILKEKSSKEKKAVLVSIHDINTAARFADKVILLSKKSLSGQMCFSGNVETVFTSENLSSVYGANVKVWKHPELNVPQI